MKSRTASLSNGTSGPFYGKPIDMETALETTHQLVDYFDALKRNANRMPPKPHINLLHLLRCNKIASQYYTHINLQLKGINHKRSCLADEEVVYVWIFAHKLNTKKPLIKLGNLKLQIVENEMGNNISKNATYDGQSD